MRLKLIGTLSVRLIYTTDTSMYSKGIPYYLYLEIGEESISCADKVFIFRFVNTHIHYSHHFREWMVKVVREISNL